MKTLIANLLACGFLVAQAPVAPNPTQEPVSSENAARMAAGATPIYRVTVVARTMKAINYHHRSGSTHIGFRGTALMPKAVGEAKVESKQGVVKIDAEMQKLDPATQFGPEYLTYVMWAITPEGRATNVGEVLLSGGKSNLHATTELQSFGLIITAEPYFAVTRPSDVVVMENFVRQDTTGTIEEVDAKYELLQRGQYTLNVNPSDIKPFPLDKKVPLELYEARNAIQIARWTGAERYAADTFHKAEIGLLNAEGYLKGKAGSKPIGTVAREAVQMAEDARIITIKKIEDELLANERKAGLDREARSETARIAAQSDATRIANEAEIARVMARREAERVAEANEAQTAALKTEAERIKMESDARVTAAQAERDRIQSESATAKAEADKLKAEADKLKMESEARVAAAQAETDRLQKESAAAGAAAQSEVTRLKAESDARVMAAKAETDRIAAAGAAAKAESEARANAASAEAERLKHENEAQRAATQAALDRAASEKTQAEAEKQQLRAQLLLQFNAILQTRDTARGLIVNMSDVLFDTGKFSLRPAAREKLARVAGILAGHPGLTLLVEGFTDSVGGDDYNQTLSENRAASVVTYLTTAGIPSGSVTSKGFGKTQPVASNDTAAGRQQNRRVELVISGEIIGSQIR